MDTAELQTNVSNQVFDIDANRIHADEGFNCRGYIPPSTVIDLGKSIKENGLQQPITIQPYDDERKRRFGKDYRIIQGHRRFTAMTEVLKWNIIPCMITEGLTELEALKMNFIENIQREPLNILQEARALEKMRYAGMTQLDMARELRQERPWVQTRLYVLDFPADIQEEIGKGTLNQAQVHEVHALDPKQWYPAVRHIKDAREKANGKRVKIRTTQFKTAKPETLTKAKPRKVEEVNVLLEYLMEHGEPGMHTRTLAWVTGRVSTLDYLNEVKTYVEAENPGRAFPIPVNGIAGL